ncbi:MAG: hypothetical protein AAFQ42_05570 [Pseudomonadota bacterium]
MQRSRAMTHRARRSDMQLEPTAGPAIAPMLGVFALLGPPAGFVALALILTATGTNPEGVWIILYALHPLGMLLIYACGLAPAVATGAILQSQWHRPWIRSAIGAAATGATVSGLWAVVGLGLLFPRSIDTSVAYVAVIGAFAALVCARVVRSCLRGEG